MTLRQAIFFGLFLPHPSVEMSFYLVGAHDGVAGDVRHEASRLGVGERPGEEGDGRGDLWTRREGEVYTY